MMPDYLAWCHKLHPEKGYGPNATDITEIEMVFKKLYPENIPYNTSERMGVVMS